MEAFRLTNWIDIQQTDHAVLVSGDTLIWQALARLPEYVTQHTTERQIAASAKIHPTALIADQVVIGERVTIGPYCVIEPNVIIGADTTLGFGCYVRPYVLIGQKCQLGHAVEVKQSWLCNEVKLPHFNYVGNSIFGYKVHLGGGAMVANFKSNGSDIVIAHGTDRIDTGLRKFGAVLGDRAEIGAGAILNPGTLIGHDSVIYPGAIVRGIIPANKIYKVKSRDIEIVDKQ